MRTWTITQWILALVAVGLFCWIVPRAVFGELAPRDLINETAEDIQLLQPYVSEQRAHRLAVLIVEAAYETYIPPQVQVAYIFRESSFSPAVEQQAKIGALGERGLTQLHPRYLRRLPELLPQGCDESLAGARCQILTGAKVHAYWKARCPGSTWRYLASYAHGRCVSEQQARMTKGAQNARSYVLKLGGIESWVE